MTIEVRLAATVVVLMGLFASGSARCALAQRATGDTSVAAIVRAFREERPSPSLVAVLRQARGPQSLARREELADSLVAIALADSNDVPSAQSARAAVRALAIAGAILDQRSGTPFEGSYPRLRRIALEGPPGVRAAALYRLALVPDSAFALREVSDIAARGEPGMATWAVLHLANDMGSRGTDELRRLLATSAIRDPRARDQAESIAELRGWARRP